MTNKNKSNAFEFDLVLSSVLSFVKCKIPQKHIDALRIIHQVDSELNATSLITLISGSLYCSTSTSWNILRSLNKHGFIVCGTKDDKGKLVRLTNFGIVVIGGVFDDKKVLSKNHRRIFAS
ncbi:MAG: hypothetical protein AABW73_00425 [Nanoarchaeota archaeon]